MTKLVRLRSIEHGLRRALAILDDDGARNAIQEITGVRRSASLLRKCADPDDNRHHLQYRYAVALDSACARAGHLSPLLEVYQHLVESHSQSAPEGRKGAETKLLYDVLNLQTALGDLSQTVSEGLQEEGPRGSRLEESIRYARTTTEKDTK